MSEIFRNSVFFGAMLTIVCFNVAMIIKARLKWPIFNPFLISTLLIIGALKLLDISYDEYNNSARYISFFMTPATVCLAIPLYRKLDVLKQNFAAVIGSIFAGVLANMMVIMALCMLLDLGHMEYVSLLPKSITTPIGLALCTEYGGLQSITMLAILFTGIIGNVIGEWLLKLVKVKNSMSRGLAMGAAAHAIGTAKAMEMGETEGAMAGLAIAVTGVITVVVAPFFVNFI